MHPVYVDCDVGHTIVGDGGAAIDEARAKSNLVARLNESGASQVQATVTPASIVLHS